MHRVHFDLGGKRQVERSETESHSQGTWRKGQWMWNEADVSEPLKNKASKTCEKCPKEQSNNFLSPPLCQKTLLLGRRGLGRTLRGGSEGEGAGLWHCPHIAKHLDKQEHGLLWLLALLKWFLFSWRNPNLCLSNSLFSPSTPREAHRYLCC